MEEMVGEQPPKRKMGWFGFHLSTMLFALTSLAILMALSFFPSPPISAKSVNFLFSTSGGWFDDNDQDWYGWPFKIAFFDVDNNLFIIWKYVVFDGIMAFLAVVLSATGCEWWVRR